MKGGEQVESFCSGMVGNESQSGGLIISVIGTMVRGPPMERDGCGPKQKRDEMANGSVESNLMPRRLCGLDNQSRTKRRETW